MVWPTDGVPDRSLFGSWSTQRSHAAATLPKPAEHRTLPVTLAQRDSLLLNPGPSVLFGGKKKKRVPQIKDFIQIKPNGLTNRERKGLEEHLEQRIPLFQWLYDNVPKMKLVKRLTPLENEYSYTMYDGTPVVIKIEEGGQYSSIDKFLLKLGQQHYSLSLLTNYHGALDNFRLTRCDSEGNALLDAQQKILEQIDFDCSDPYAWGHSVGAEIRAKNLKYVSNLPDKATHWKMAFDIDPNTQQEKTEFFLGTCAIAAFLKCCATTLSKELPDVEIPEVYYHEPRARYSPHEDTDNNSASGQELSRHASRSYRSSSAQHDPYDVSRIALSLGLGLLPF